MTESATTADILHQTVADLCPRFVGEIQKIPDRPNPSAKMPSPLFLVGKALNALLLDRVENDIERLQRINQMRVGCSNAVSVPWAHWSCRLREQPTHYHPI